jgi:hypothetical protein
LVKGGKYKIENSILTQYDMQMLFIDSLVFTATEYRFELNDQKISFQNNTMIQRYTEIFQPTTSNDSSLLTTWRNIRWTFVAKSNNSKLYYNGRRQNDWKFDKITSKSYLYSQYIDSTSNTIDSLWTYYTFTSSILDIGNTGDSFITVEFKSGKMYWYFDYEPYYYYRK